jgi:DNA-binding MarR family transcriptional regulator/prophage maintenance system killer protein
MSDFEEYIRQGEPDKKEKGIIWQTAIGLQQVDGLTPSVYLIETAKENIEGKITIDEVKYRINSYYKQQTSRKTIEGDRTEEADTINATLDYDFKQEKNFNYKGLSKREIVEHIANFISGLWQIHAFGEGNTRTIAVFTIKYLRTFGFEVENNMFANHSWYFRNALVRANYNDYEHKIYATSEYLMLFFGNLLLGENNELKNRHLHIDATSKNVEKQGERLKISEGGQKNDFGGQKKWSEKVVRLLELIIEKPNITRKELSESLQINSSAVQKHIEKLKKEGIIAREGSDKKGSWKVLKEQESSTRIWLDLIQLKK